MRFLFYYRAMLCAGTWNVRTLYETGAARILVEELRKAQVNMMGLQEVRWQGAGEIKVSDYTPSFGPAQLKAVLGKLVSA